MLLRGNMPYINERPVGRSVMMVLAWPAWVTTTSPKFERDDSPRIEVRGIAEVTYIYVSICMWPYAGCRV